MTHKPTWKGDMLRQKLRILSQRWKTGFTPEYGLLESVFAMMLILLALDPQWWDEWCRRCDELEASKKMRDLTRQAQVKDDLCFPL